MRTLARELDRVRRAVGQDRPGRCLLIRGRRRVGKSRLVEPFLDRNDCPSLYFTAPGGGVTDSLRSFVGDAANSTLPDREVLAAGRPDSWDSAFRLLAAALPDTTPSVVVVDEV